jgi:ketopantoate reductase
MSTSRPTFAIMGSGGVGGYFGARLARAGFDTTLWRAARIFTQCVKQD